ncbi:MAG: hypothetical protein NC350_05120, partial [Corallococcus sp.]|nr:hypothetical protein [Corallococcus sp.]
MSVDTYYANGRVAVLSTKLFGADKFARIAESRDMTEAVKTLAESGFGGGIALENPNDYELLLRNELNQTVELLKELSSDKYVTRYF